MTDNENSQDTNISTEKINLSLLKEKDLDNESQKFFGYINNNKTQEIKKFLSDNKKEIWKYLTKDEMDETVVHISIKTDEIPIISVILKYCQTNLSKDDFKELINKKNSKGVAALHYASFHGNVDIIKYLINYGADIKVLTGRKLNVIHYAAQGNKPNSLVYYYLFHKNEIDLEKVDNGGSTPLHWASFSPSVELSMYLLNYGVNINKKDKNGNTPLHLAVIKNSYKMVQKLLQNGANTDIKNNENRTPKDIALKSNLKDIYELLKESESCQFCNIKAPTQKETKSRKNIIIAFVFQAIAFFILFFFNFPYISYNKRNFLYSFFFWGYSLFTIIFIILYIILIFMNPGRPTKKLTIEIIRQLMKKKEVKINLFKYCPKCLVRRAKNLRHCIICDQCCENFDHHCYWVNNCIGKNNYSYFIIFLFLSFFDVFYILLICIYSFFVGKIRDIDDVINQCKENDFKSFGNFQKIPQCLIFSNNKTLQIILNVFLLLSNLFFLVPQFLLVLIHSKNLCERKKKKKGRNSTVVSASNEDYLLNEIMNSEQEYSVTDFN